MTTENLFMGMHDPSPLLERARRRVRRASCLLLCAVLALGLAACGAEERPGDVTPGTEGLVADQAETSASATAPAEDDIPAPADVAAPPTDATKTASGLAYKVLAPGSGSVHPKAQDTVSVHYTGWTTDGKMFDSSVKRGAPASFGLNRVIAGWTEGVQLMVEGEKARFWIPEDLAYKGRPGAPAGMLVFDVELLGITSAPEPIPVPEDVGAAPADATVEESGLAHKLLAAGTGTKHPRAHDQVKVHYSGWTSEGEMFDSSVMRGKPADIVLNRVIRGWGEGVQLMVVGEKRRFWIPEDLAYRGQRGAPPGTLVFDVELLGITELPAPPAAPDDVAGPPADAEKTASGLASRVLSPGTGTRHPAASDTVTVHYTGWTTLGNSFDSSVARGEPARLSLSRVIEGWQEGLQLMVVGEKRRLWIPENLAYKGRPGGPPGMLVFDVELIGIDEPAQSAAPATPE